MIKNERFLIEKSQSKLITELMDVPKVSNDIKGLIQINSGQEVTLASNISLLAPETKHFTDIAVIAGGNAVVNIDEKIIIERSATNSETFLKVLVLIVSGNPKITVLPKMEIKTNTAIARHAVSTIKLSGESLFYSQSRGLSEKVLKELLIKNIIERYGH